MKKPLMVTIVTSISPESPCETGGWKLYSFARNKFVTDVDADLFVAGYDRATGEVVPADEELAGKLGTGLAYWLSYHEHGVGAWSLKGEGRKCRFDTAVLAGVLVREDEPRSLGPTTADERAADARRFLERYTSWANGCVYDWDVREAGTDEPVAAGTEWYDEKDMFDRIVAAVGGRPVVVRGNGAWLARYHGDGLAVVNESDLLDDLLAGDDLGDGGDEPDVDELTEHQECERADEYYGG